MKSKKFAFVAACVLTAALGAAEPNTLTPAEASAGWHLLFDGRSLAGWTPNESPSVFTVVGGQIVVKGPRCHLFYTGPVSNHDFRNFELSLEILTSPRVNSGVYFHTAYQSSGWPGKGYEVQVNNSAKSPRRTASLYGIQDDLVPVASDGRWFTLRIRVEGRHITTRVDDKLILNSAVAPMI